VRYILQSEASECGLACIATIASHHGHQLDLAELRRKFSISLKGATLAQLMRHAAALDFVARPLRTELDGLAHLALPCILHWNLNHFVVLTKVRTGLTGKVSLTLFDPALGIRRMTLQEAGKHFTGVAMELSPNPAFVKKDERREVSISQMVGKVVGLRRAIVQMILLALTLEMFAICAPLFNQFVVDDVITGGDRSLLPVLVAGFAILIVTQNLIGLARSWFLMRWSMDISFQWSTRVLAHLVRLPLAFFEKRHMGDILSRFSSVGAIQGTLTSVFLESLLDGLMTILALAMMLSYSVPLTLLILASVALYSGLRWAFYHPFREASLERLVLGARESSHFMETLRAVAPLKLFGRETERLARWQNLKQDVQNRDVQTQKMAIMFRLSNTLIFSLQGLALFYIGAGQVIDGTMSIGMLMAFASYAGTFTGRISSLIDLFISVKMLSMHTERLGDIVLEEVEPEVAFETDTARLSPAITIRQVKFRYAEGEPWVLDGIDLTIPAGQSMALVGASGCGKTTLCKIVLGLLKPAEGDVLIDGIPITQLGLRAYRQLLGTVMQEDTLLAGSIMDNIAFFDGRADQQRVERSATLAAVHDDIKRMPMGYQTLVGDMGSSLSGGQKQRVLLARALYKQPRILVLDEATSNLDLDNERRVAEALATLDLTRIVIAHRPETIAAAQRVVEIRNGKIVERRPFGACMEDAA
jgi:ATP-binding cassette subfamily B protein RaxB